MKIYLVLLFLLFNSEAIAQTGSTVLSLTEFLSRAEKNDPNFERILSEKQRLKFLVDAGLPTRQLLINAQQEYGFSTESGDRTSVLSVGVSKTIIETGTELSVERTNTERPDREEELTEIRLEQALWNNFLGRDTRLLKDSLEDQKKIVYLQILESYEDYLGEMAKLYLDYSQAHIELRLAEEIHKESLNLQKNVVAMRRKNIANSTDVARANLQVLLAKEDVLNKKTDLETQREKVRLVIGGAEPPSVPEVDINLSKELGFRKPEGEIDYSKLRSIEEAMLLEKVGEKNLKLTRRGGAPDLNLVLGYNMDDSSRFGTRVQRDESVVGLSLRLPFGDSVTKANIQASSLDLLQSQLDRITLERSLKNQAIDLRNQLLRSYEMLELSREKVKLTEQIYREENRRYQRGTLTLDTLIEVRRDLTQYRFQYQSDLVTHNKIVIDWLNFTDSLLKRTI